MIVGSVSEERNLEKRVAITPEIVKKYKGLGLEVCLSKDYALHLGISDKDYEVEGASVLSTEEEVISKSDVVLQMSVPNNQNLNKLRPYTPFKIMSY